MQIEQRALVAAPFPDLWKLVLDVPRVATCLPGAQDVEEAEPGVFTGRLRVRVGAISVALQGRVSIVEVLEDSGEIRLRVEATDRRIGGSVTADASLVLVEVDPATTELNVRADAAILGRLGQFGQAVMRKKADQILGQFVERVVGLLGTADEAVMVAGAPGTTGAAPVTGRVSAGRSAPAAHGHRVAGAVVPAEGMLQVPASAVRTALTALGLGIGCWASARRNPALAVLGLSVVVAGGNVGRPHDGVRA